jgi:septum formation protein
LEKQLVLASSSKYRRDLLLRLAIPFHVRSPDVDETPLFGEAPSCIARRLALKKAEVVGQEFPNAWIIGSDQVVDLHGRALGKPGNHERAVAQLRQMSGHAVVFQTAVAVVHLPSKFTAVEVVPVEVVFRELTDSEIETYLHIDQPYDCAGSAKSESLGVSLLERMTGDDPTALIGLPMIATCRLLRQSGLDVLKIKGLACHS